MEGQHMEQSTENCFSVDAQSMPAKLQKIQATCNFSQSWKINYCTSCKNVIRQKTDIICADI